DVLGRVQDKRHQLAVAAEVGLAVPRTADEPTDTLGFPVLVKPSDPTGFRRRFGVKAFRCASAGELDRHFDDARDFRPFVQEWIPGGDDTLWTVGSYLAADGEELGLFTGRKLLQTPREIGTARVAEAGGRPAPVRRSGDGKGGGVTLARGAGPALQRPPYVDAMWARDDPKPAFVHLARVVRP